RIRIGPRLSAFIEIDAVLCEHVGCDGEGNLDGLAGREFDLLIRKQFEPAGHRFRNGVVPVELGGLLTSPCADILNEGARWRRRASCDAEHSAAEHAVRQGEFGVRIPFTVVIFGQAPAFAEFLEVRTPALAVILERLWIAGERWPANAPLPI